MVIEPAKFFVFPWTVHKKTFYCCFLLSVYKHHLATLFSQRVCEGKNRIVNSHEPFQISLGMLVYLLFSILAIRRNKLYAQKQISPPVVMLSLRLAK